MYDLGLPEPLHPLITITNFRTCTKDVSYLGEAGVLLNFYLISLKNSFTGTVRYGQNFYDYDNGGLSFVSPNQLQASDGYEEECEGVCLVIHPDFFNNYPIAKTIKNYGYFSYAANEALHLSEKEKIIVTEIYRNIEEELKQRIDAFSQNIIISQIESLFNYCDRFYQRQFMTRKVVNNDLLFKMESLLDQYFNQKSAKDGLPTVQYLADQLGISSSYLSDMLRTLTGLNAQQHIHQKMIEKAKEYLVAGDLSIAEIAYKLGFEHPPSFTRIFKRKLNLTPHQYQNQSAKDRGMNHLDN
jgi:AraC-like DNA-binding protein